VNGSTILSVASYTISAVFTPADSTDYSGTSAQIMLTVTKAGTSTGAGITQNVVAADGSGNFASVGTALQSLPATGGALYVKPGTYKEQVIVKNPNVAFYGLGGDPTKVIITDDLSAGPNNFNSQLGDQGSATVQVLADGFYADHLTLQNTFDLEQNQDTTPNAQALALWVSADKAVFNTLDFIGRQDTVYGGSKGCSSTTCTPARQYFYNAYVEGNVDYIFGDGATVFESSTIHTVYHGTAGGEATITAQNKKYTGSGSYLSGEVFSNSTLTAENDSGAMTNLYLGRPWGTYSTNVWLNTNMAAPVNPAGWIEFTPGVTNNLPTSYYAEYNSYGLGAAGPREQYAMQLTAATADPWQPLTFLAGSDGWESSDRFGARRRWRGTHR
jgi:pectinesterase